MANTLVDPIDLEDFPGAPFPDGLVDSAVAEIRTEAGWHIAPEITETVTVDARGGVLLMLPTLRLVSVAEIRDVSGDAPEVLEDWRFSRAGMVHRPEGWPLGFRVLEVDMTHGFALTPEDLYTVVAQRAHLSRTDVTIGQETAGGESISYRTRTDGALRMSALDFYKLPVGQ